MKIAAVLALTAALASPAGAAPAKSKPKAKAAAHLVAAKPAAAPALPPLPVASLAIAPKEATLTGPRAVQHFVVTATLQDGTTLDVTDRAVFRLAAPKVAKLSAAGVATPVA